MRGKIFAAAIAAATATSPLRAATISQAASFDTPVSTASSGYFAIPVPIKRFDPIWGHLTGWGIQLAGGYWYRVATQSPDALNACCVYGAVEGQFQVEGFGAAFPPERISIPGHAGEYATVRSEAFSDNTGIIPIVAGDTDVVEGTGNANAAFYGQFWIFHEVDGTGQADISGNLEMRAVVTYQYDPVPEPATWGLMLSGFGLIGGALRRRITEFRRQCTRIPVTEFR